MPQCHLSQEFVADILKTLPEKTVRHVDKDLRGFLLEYRPSGKGTWYFRYRHGKGKTRHFRIGSAETIDVSLAREYAYRIFAVVRDGGDPKQEVFLRHKALTTRVFVFEHYPPNIKLKKRSWKLDIRTLEKYFFPAFGERSLQSIKHVEMVQWHNSLPKRKLLPSSCNRILAVIRSVFNSAVRWGFLDIAANPCRELLR